MGKRIDRVKLEPIELWDVWLKSHYLGRRKYENPVSGEEEDRKPTILFGIKMLLNRSRVRENEKETIKKSFLRYLPNRWAFQIRNFVKRAKKAWNILWEGKEKETEKFEYGKVRELSDFYRIAMSVGKSTGWLYAVNQPDVNEEKVVNALEKFVKKGFWKGRSHFNHYREDRK